MKIQHSSHQMAGLQHPQGEAGAPLNYDPAASLPLKAQVTWLLNGATVGKAGGSRKLEGGEEL